MEIDICRLWEYCPRNTDMSKKSQSIGFVIPRCKLRCGWDHACNLSLDFFWHISYVSSYSIFDVCFPLWLIDVSSVIFSPCRTWKAPPSSWFLSKAAGWVNWVRQDGRELVLSIIWNSLFAPPVSGCVSKKNPGLISNCAIRISPVEWWQQTSLI